MTVRLFLAAAGLVLVTGAVLQQSALSQLGLTEAAARGLMLEEVRNGGTDTRVLSARWHTRLIMKGRASYQNLPVAQRAGATTGLFAWARAFTGSPAFKTAYTGIRAELKPTPRQYARTIEEEIKKEVDEQLAEHEQMKRRVRPAWITPPSW